MPTAVILSTVDDEIRLSLDSAAALARALCTLLGITAHPLTPDLAERGYSKELRLCPATGEERWLCPDSDDVATA